VAGEATPSVRNVVIGQPVDEAKRARAKELRREMTPAEQALWERLRGNQLDGLHFRRQQPIEGFIVDFYCHAAAVVVEVDGQVHDEQEGYDTERDQILTARGFQVVRFRNEQVMSEMESVLREIGGTCRARMGSAGPNPPLPVPGREGGADPSPSSPLGTGDGGSGGEGEGSPEPPPPRKPPRPHPAPQVVEPPEKPRPRRKPQPSGPTLFGDNGDGDASDPPF
jgi:very-short-patch-repair endonuclease